jgi:hypothetical protein
MARPGRARFLPYAALLSCAQVPLPQLRQLTKIFGTHLAIEITDKHG